MTEINFSNSPLLEVGRMDFQNVLIMACRYASKTNIYANSIAFQEFVQPLIPHLRMKTLSVMFKDIDTYLNGNEDFDTNRATWESFADSLAVEISSRGCRYNPMYGSWESID